MRKLYRYIAVFIVVCNYHIVQSQSIVINNPSSCTIGLNLTDGACDPSINVIPDPERVVINVNNAPGDTLGVDVFLQEVQLIITHTWANDLDIKLRSPGGIEIPLSMDNGGGDDNYGDINQPNCSGVARLSMSSCTSIVGAMPPFTDQTYRPQGSFYDFNDNITDPNGLWELSICDDAQGDLGRLEYVNLVFAPLTCLPIESISIENIDTTAVTLNWQPSSNCGDFVIEYGTPGFTPGSGMNAGMGTLGMISNCPLYTLTGLQADTDYELYFRTVCSGTQISANSCPISFTTGCLPAAASERSNFDNLAPCATFCDTECDFDALWQNSDLNDYDWLVNSGPTLTFGTGPDADVNGNGQFLYLEASGQICADNKTAYLVSNCMQLEKQGTDSCHLSFYYHMYGDGIGSLSLEVSDDGGFSWDNLWQESGNQGNEWQKVYISLGDYTEGSIIQLRFVGQEGSSSRGDIAIDDIIFYGSINLGDPAFEYYADNDNDGFGDADVLLRSCSAAAPPGFVSVAGDCEDDDPNINPGEAEIPCNDVDENCNGNIDNSILPPPSTVSDTICPGESAVVCATPNFDRFIFWYDENDNFIGFGECFFPNVSTLVNNSPAPITYTFFAEESDGLCSSGVKAPAYVTVNPQPDVTLNDLVEICPGTPLDLGSLNFEDANFTGGTLSFHDALPTSTSNELSSSIIEAQANTTYAYRVSTDEGCYDEGSIPVSVQSGAALSFSPSDSFSLCRENSTLLSVIPQTPGNYDYQWSTGSTSNQIEVEANFMAGSTDFYHVTVTDEEGCLSIDTVRINTTVSIDSLRRFVTDVSTCAGNDGSITLIPLDGTSPFSYQWQGTNGIVGDSSGIADTLIINNLSQGTYRITVSDASEEACTLILRSVIINGPSAVIEEPVVEDISCFGANDGSICLSFFGGNPSFAWSTNETTSCIDNLSSGFYSVTVTEGDCETIIEDIEIKEPEILSVLADLQMPSCTDASNGSIALTVFGGTAPYDYNWEAIFFNSNMVDNLSQGTYSVTITDRNDCQLIQHFELNAPDPIEISIDTLVNISCTGLTDGMVKVNVSGGTPPYQYQWSNNSTAPLNVNLMIGTYDLTVTDFNDCEQTFSINITEPSPIELSLVTTNNPECVGEKDGSILVEASGGTIPYTYSWNIPGDSSLLENLAVGNYTAYVTDINNCPPDTLEIELNAISVLDLEVSINAPHCIGQETGSISLIPQGTAPFHYQWERGDTTSDINALAVGEYFVRIEDGQGCLYDTSLVIDAPQVFGVDFNVVQPTCAGDEDGLIDVNIFVPGGTPPYQPPISYQWNDGFMGNIRIGIEDGDYAVSIIDAQGCEYQSDTIIIQAPDELELGLEGLGLISCHGDTTGFIEVGVRGGLTPYTYNWVGQNTTTEDIYNIGAGEYRLLVLDANSCPVDTLFTLVEPNPLTVAINVQAEEDCEGGVVEEICGLINGGISPYTLSWNDGSNETCIDNPPPADYILSVTDANGCTEISIPRKVKEFTEAFQLDTFYVEDVSCRGLNDGCAIATVSGGTSNYRFHFSGGCIIESDTSTFKCSGLSPGNYRVTVTDLTNGCVDVSEWEIIAEPDVLEFKRDSIESVDCFGSNDGGIFTSASGGIGPYTFYWQDEMGNTLPDSIPDINHLVAGQYTGYIIDANGCKDSIAATIPSLNELIRDTLVNITPVSCKGDSTGAIQLTILGGAPPYNYEWSNSSNEANIDMLPAGTYGLTVTDSDTCRAIFPIYTIEEPESMIELSYHIDSVLCGGASTGAIEVFVDGGMTPYNYEWRYEGSVLPSESSSLISNQPAGTYQLRLEDSNQCIQFYDFQIYEPPILNLFIDIVPPVSPDPGTATAHASGGVPDYEYLWNTGEMDSMILVTAGNYEVSVTDANGCEISGRVLLTSSYEVNYLLEANIFPNPTRQDLHIEAELNSPLSADLLILTPQGQTLLNKSIEETSMINTQLNVNALASGVYWIMIYADNRIIYASKFIKTN
jgi:subtilisin-like proprotein convertase family protein